MNLDSEEGVVMIKRAEIDTRAPFRSVKEAVSLFGERVLAGELYNPTKLKEVQLRPNNVNFLARVAKMQVGASENGQGASRIGTVTAELEETKQSLEKAKEESMVMAHCLSSLREELERTKQELWQLKKKERGMEKQVMDDDQKSQNVEDVKVVEDDDHDHGNHSTRLESIKMKKSASDHHHHHQQGDQGVEFQKKRYVTFANPPSLAQVVIPQDVETLERHPSLRKKKKKPLIPLIGGIFSKKKPTQEVAASRIP